MEKLDTKYVENQVTRIVNGDREAIDLMKLTYLQMLTSAILYNMSTIGSSRDKDDELYRWRYAANSAALYETFMYQKKAAKIERKMGEIQELKNSDKAEYEARLPELEALKQERDLVKAIFYTKIADYDKLKNFNDQIKGYGINFSDIDLSIEEILKLVKTFVSPGKENFWSKYIENEKKFSIANIKATPANVGGAMGE